MNNKITLGFLIAALATVAYFVWFARDRPGTQATAVADRKLLHHLKQAHKDKVAQFAISPDGKRFATTSNDNSVKLWETATGKELRKWQFPYPAFPAQDNSFARNLVFTTDGMHLVTANADTTLYLLGLPN